MVGVVSENRVGSMTYDVLGPKALDYLPCHYGTSRLVFRGPQRVLEAPYVAFVGGTQTFGKFIEQPYPLRVEHLTGVTSVNLGQVGAGVDVFLSDQMVQQVAQYARVTVLEVLGAAHMSNPLYKVHRRRNDRFLSASAELRNLYPEVDFTEFSFVKHMLRQLSRVDPTRFAVVKRKLQKVWQRRMRRLVGRLGEQVVLVRFNGKRGDQQDDWEAEMGIGPAFVTDEMLAQLEESVGKVVDLPPERSRTWMPPEDGLVFDMWEEAAAQTVAGPQTHQSAADRLRPVLDGLM